MDPDQTAPGSTLFVYKALDIFVDDKKNIHFEIMRFKVARPKKLIKSLPNYK